VVGECNESKRLLLEGAIRTFHPDWPDPRVVSEISRRMLRETT
jgi:hypothetical protein